MRLLHLSDPHVTDGGRRIAGRDPAESLREAVDVLKESAIHDVDAVLVTGDLTTDGGDAAYAFVESQLLRLGLPTMVLAGNHDDPNAVAELRARLPMPFAAAGEPETTRGPAPLDVAYRYGGLSFVLLDTRSGCVEESGRVEDATLAWLERSVIPVADRILLALHQPPIALAPGVVPLGNADALAAVVGAAAPTIVALLAGHVHRCTATAWRGTTLVTVSSPNHQIAFAAGPDGSYQIADEPGMAAWVDLRDDLSVHYIPLRPRDSTHRGRHRDTNGVMPEGASCT